MMVLSAFALKSLLARVGILGQPVRNIPTEVNLGAHQTAFAHRVNLAVTEYLARACATFVDDEGDIALLRLVDRVEADDRFTIGQQIAN